MKSLKDLKIGVRLNLVLNLVLVMVVAVLSVFLIRSQKGKIILDTDILMEERVGGLATAIEQELHQNTLIVNQSSAVASELLKLNYDVTVDKSAVQRISATEQISLNKSEINIPTMMFNGVPIYQNYDFVDKIQSMTGATATVFQRIPQGFLRISTNVRKENGDRAVGTYISNESPVAKAILAGQKYQGRAFVVNDWFLTVYEPLYVDGQIAGIVYVGIPEKNLSDIRALFKTKKYYDTGYPFIVDEDGNMIVHPTSEGKNFKDQEFFQQLAEANSEHGKTYYMWEGKQKYQYFQYIPQIKSYVSASIYEHELLGMINNMRIIILAAGAVALLIFFFIISYLSKNISRALNEGVEFAQKISEGNLDATLQIKSKDEVGMLGEALNNMKIRLREIVLNIINGSDNIAEASQQMSATSEQLSQGASEQASNVEEVSSTMEEMAANIQQNTESSQQTEQITLSSFEGIKQIAESTKKSVEATNIIADKIQIVNDIALQTNILALNAAVEAARAGEQGKGFAVVAAEVRKLAERSKIAADEIVELSQNSKTVAEEVGKKLEEMLPEIEKSTNLVQEISASSLEQNNGAGQINSAIQQLNSVTQQNAASAEEMATSAEELASQADVLKEQVSFFKIDSDKSHKRKAVVSRTNVQKKPQQTIAKTQVSGNGSSHKESVHLDLRDSGDSDGDFERY